MFSRCDKKYDIGSEPLLPFETNFVLLATLNFIRVSSLWKNHGNLEYEQNLFQTWKSHGILKKLQKSGKNHGFEKKNNLEKSWNFVSDSKHCETHFSHATRAFQTSLIHTFVNFVVHLFCPNLFISCDQSVHRLLRYTAHNKFLGKVQKYNLRAVIIPFEK